MYKSKLKTEAHRSQWVLGQINLGLHFRIQLEEPQ